MFMLKDQTNWKSGDFD